MKKIYLIALLFYTVNLFSQQKEKNLIPVLIGNKYGFATEDKKNVIPAKYDFASPFYPGYKLTQVIMDGKPFLINRKGKIVFNGSVDYLKTADYKDNSELLPEKLNSIDLEKNCQSINCPSYSVILLPEYSNFFDKVGDLYVVSDQKKVFLIDEKGKRKSDLYDRIRHIPYGEFEHCITEDSTTNKKGLLDKNGSVLLTCTYDEIFYQGKGIFTIKDNNVSHDYKVVLQNKSIDNSNEQKQLVNNRLKIKRKNAKTGVVDTLGNNVVSFTYERLYPLIGEKFIFLKENKTGIINAKEECLFVDSVADLQSTVPYYPFTDSLIFFLSNKKWILVDVNGKQYNRRYDCYYVDYQKVVSGIAGVCVNEKIALINTKAEFVVPPIYDEIQSISNNRSFLVRTNKQWKWLSENGKVIYDSFNDFSFSIKDYLFINKNNKWFFVDLKGNEFYSE